MVNSDVILLSADEVLSAEVCAALGAVDLRVSVLAAPELLVSAAGTRIPPAAVLVDIVTSREDDVGPLVRSLRTACDPATQILCLIDFSWVHARVAALRAGALRCLPKPVIQSQLAQVMTGVVKAVGDMPIRVLIVDDDEAVAQLHAELLLARGIDARTLSDSLQILDVVREFVPDVLLLDMYMPGLSGLEVAALLREDDRYLDLPIVFLSVERQFERQLAALSWGGDLFLTKPVGPAELTTVVFSRARRARRPAPMSESCRNIMRESEFQRRALDAHAIVSITNPAGQITHTNEAFSRISGYPAAELLGQNHRLLKSGRHPDGFYREMWETISKGEIWHGEICNRRKDGELYWVESTIVPFLDGAGLPYQYVSVRTDVTPLVLARDEAYCASRAKSDFLASMSHEFRTPLNAVLGFAQLLESDPAEPLSVTQAAHTGHIIRAGWHLLDLVNAVLDLAKIDQSTMTVSLDSVDVGDVVRNALSQVKLLAQEVNVSIRFQHEAQASQWVLADAGRLTQCVHSLLANAVKYNRPGGEVSIVVDESNGRVRISVRDTGVGMTTEQLGRLFRPFDRLGAEFREVAGGGVGLVLTRELLRLMGGTIGVSSEPGQGSLFWIDFPARSPTATS